MPRETARRVLIVAAAVVFALALIRRFHSLGGPYFDFFPQTIQEHVSVHRWPSADAIVLSRNAAKLLPRGATVTILQPSQAPNYDATHFLTGVGLMPHQRVIKQDLAQRPQFVLALREPFEHPSYRLLHEVEGGRIYGLRE